MPLVLPDTLTPSPLVVVPPSHSLVVSLAVRVVDLVEPSFMDFSTMI